MSLPLLLDELAARRIELRLEDGKLRYRAPEGALTPELRERLGTQRDALVAYLRGQPLPEPELLSSAPASAQERLWFINQLQGPNSTYNIPLVLRLRGDLEPAAMRAALDDLVHRHQSLRGAFRFAGDTLRFEIIRDLRAPWVECDLAGLGEVERTARLRSAVTDIVLHHFDLAQAPLMRATLVRLGPREHVLALNFHHIATDGWSFGIILQELAAGYEARRDGRAPALPPLKWQYTDYIAWQEQLRQRGVMDGDLAFWRERLAGAPTCTTLPPDLRRPPVQEFTGAFVALNVDAATTARLRAKAREWGSSLNHLTLAASAILLADFSGSRDIVIGLPLANRTRRELEPLVGMFVNVMPLRLAVDPEQSLSAFVALVKRANAEAMEHCQLPFERLVEALVSRRDLSMSPLFQVAYNFLPPMERTLSFGGLEAVRPELVEEGGISKHDCTFYIDESEGGIAGSIEYSTRLYRRDTAERWVRAFLEILRAMVDRTDAPLGDIAGVGREDGGKIAAWSAGPERALPIGSPWARFAVVVRDQPDTVVVDDGRERTTYAELARRAGLVAAQLAERGVDRGARVGLLLPRGSDLLAAMLGVVQRGAVFVPFDRDQPPERLAKMAAKARLAVVLCRPGETAAERLGLATIGIDAALWRKEPTAPEPATIGPDDPLYMIFTSGSTGVPKAVIVPWRGLNNIAQCYGRLCRLASGERVAQIASPDFDASLLEIWPALLAGATLAIVPGEERLDPAALRDWLLRERIAVHFSPTPLAEALIDLEWPAQAPLRLLLTGGQALRKRPRPGLPFCLLNNYGPTEASIAVTCGVVAETREDNGLPSIGRPIDNTQIVILNETRRRVPLGAVGELYVTGAGVALGYFEDPEATARNFVKLSGETETRWYRTGDLVRLLAEGELEFLGRVDRQIKLRGYRIELGEIESALLRIAGVRQAAVRLEGEQLVAYLEAGADGPAPEKVRRQLAAVLPAAMLPAHCVILERLPRQSSGKIDIRELPLFQPVAAAARTSASAALPSDSLEAGVARAWATVLAQPAPGRDDNFFDLGGHSLLLVRLKERIAAETGREVSVLDLFRHPTIARQAEFFDGGKSAKPETPRARSRLPSGEAIAIIGMAGRFPEADNIEAFWENLCAGRDCISRFSREELLDAGVPADLVDRPDYVPANGVLKNIDGFDAEFFGIPAREAEVMDPQQRLLLEEAWHVFEDAGYDPAQIEGRVGVFVGSSLNGYLIENVLPRHDLVENLGGFAVLINNDKDFAATRLSYKLNLRGPSVSVNTACSTSLVAVHQAVTALRDGQCELALAGGSCVRSRQIDGYRYENGGVLSRDGKCRAFDAAATGMVGGNGVTLVLLKPLAAALADRDPIYAVIKGIAVNNDGSDKVGFTAPGIHGQSLVIRDALERADVDPQTVRYVETHGTATQLGDTIEVAALAENYAPAGNRAVPLHLGSVKTNIGHLDAAAGAAGLIKAALCLHEKTLVPSLYFQTPNPQIHWPGDRFSVCTQSGRWERNGQPLRAAVSSLGIGGTNAHAVLEEAPSRADDADANKRSPRLLLVSGNSEEGLLANTAALAGWLGRHADARIHDVACTLAFGRRHWEIRRAICACSPAEAVALMAEPRSPAGKADGVAFMFNGIGTQKPGMASALYERAPKFKACIDECAEILRPILGFELRSLLLAAPDDAAAGALLNEQRVGQPAILALEYALAVFWMDLGLSPSVLIGHSLGEWVAACVAGVFTLPDALRLVSLRGGLMDAQDKGAMLAVNLTEPEVAARLPAGLDIATVNALDQIVVAGPAEAVEAFALQLETEQIRCKRLHGTVAAHSSLMEPALAPLREAIGRVRRSAPNPRMAIVGSVSGQFATPAQLQSPDYWAEHLRRCARFADGLDTLWAHPGLALLECGPSHALCNIAQRDTRRPTGRAITASFDGDNNPEGEWRRVLESAGTLWATGLPIDLRKLFALQGGGLRIPLPGHVFQRKRYWLDAMPARVATASAPMIVVEETENAPAATPSNASPMEQRVIEIMREMLGPVHLGRNSDFFLCGGDSLLVVRLAARLGDVLEIRSTRVQIMSGRTPARIAALLEDGSGAREKADHDTDGCLTRLWKGDDRRPPIVLIHAVGGGIFIYREFLQALSTRHPVYGFQAPGLWDDAAPIDDLRKQAEHYYSCLRRAGVERPIMIGGSSYGGLVGYELDRLYREAGHRSSLVALFDSPGPGYMPERFESEAEVCAYMLSRNSPNRDFSANLARMLVLDHEGRFALLLANMRETTRADLTADDVARQVRMLRQNLTNMVNWVPQPHDARLLFCKATEQSLLFACNPELAWVPLAGGGIEILPVPGDHTSMLSVPHVAFLAKAINRRLSAEHID
jgi:amino acid adenylation domain-containing protein